MSKTLVISGHPDYKNSKANKAILNEFQRLVPEAEIVRLDELYPDFDIDVAAEQKRLSEADTVVFEFPFWWYSAPSLMRRYFELVLSHGFAYGSAGTALHGKKLIMSFTAGAKAEAYTPDGAQHYTMDDFTPQLRALANLCGFDYRGEVVSYGMMLLDPTDLEAKTLYDARVHDHAQELARRVEE
ncbi:MAG: NAD(P)H-dependent oxidoreductase [Duncaniella sp.]|nr:NAD(P)H-dependent oxidoreductase [Duncaniella sp.]